MLQKSISVSLVIICCSALLIACSGGSSGGNSGSGGTGGGGGGGNTPPNTTPTNPAGTIQFSSAKFTTAEDAINNSAVVTVSRLNGTSGEVSVNYTTSDGTATVSDGDYLQSSGTLTWLDGSDEAKNIYIDVAKDNDTTEGDETIHVSLTSVGGDATLGALSDADVTIYDVAGTNTAIPDSYLFYMEDYPTFDAYIYAIDPTSPDPTQYQTVTTANHSYAITIQHVKPHPTGKTGNQLYTQAAVFFSGTSIWRVSGLVQDGPLNDMSPVKVSSESGIIIGDQCEAWSELNADDVEQSVIYYSTGQNCSVWKMVKIGWDSSVDPIVIKRPVTKIYDSVGTAVGYLAYDNTDLVRCSLDFQTCSTVVKSNIFDATYINETIDGTLLLRIDNSLYWYNNTTGLSDSIHDLQPFSFGIFNLSDGQNQYFADGTSIYALKLDGMSTPTELVSEPADSSVSLGLLHTITNDNVVYTTFDATTGSGELRIIAKDGTDNGVARTLASSPNEQIVLHAITNSRIYYNVLSDGLTPGADRSGMVMEDGSSKRELGDSQWVGWFTHGAQHFPDYVYDQLLRRVADGVVWSYNSAAYTMTRNLGTLPAEQASTFIMGGFGRYGIGTGGALGERDIYFVDMQTADSLTRITNSPSVDEVNF